jgi:hypothetical protein
MYVLLTDKNCYFVEFLIGELIISQYIGDAMIFKELDTALKFKKMLHQTCFLNTSINTFIEIPPQ